MGIIDRYASAIRSSNLRSEGGQSLGDAEVLGAMGMADRRLRDGEDCRPSPLAVPLTRLFLGDNHAANEVTAILADMVWRYADRMKTKPKLRRAQAEDLAKACLAWHRNGTCTRCGGHGVLKIPGTTHLGTQTCQACKPWRHASYGTGKVPFESQIRPEEHRPLAAWLVAEMERAMGEAGPAAMKALAPRLDL